MNNRIKVDSIYFISTLEQLKKKNEQVLKESIEDNKSIFRWELLYRCIVIFIPLLFVIAKLGIGVFAEAKNVNEVSSILLIISIVGLISGIKLIVKNYKTGFMTDSDRYSVKLRDTKDISDFYNVMGFIKSEIMVFYKVVHNKLLTCELVQTEDDIVSLIYSGHMPDTDEYIKESFEISNVSKLEEIKGSSVRVDAINAKVYVDTEECKVEVFQV